MGKIDSISQALETEHGFDLSTGKIVNVVNHHNMSGTDLLPAELDEDTQIDEYEEYGEPDDLLPVPAATNAVAVAEPLSAEEIEYKKDEKLVKKNIRELIDKSMDIADEMFEIVRMAESPKAFEPAANFLRMIVELNEKLLDVHERKDKRKGGKAGSAKEALPTANPTVNNTQNNTIICKDPADILKMLNEKK